MTNIDPNDREEIIKLYFSDFKTTIRISRMTGIPLPIVRAVVKLHSKKLALNDKREYKSEPVVRKYKKVETKPKKSKKNKNSECTCSGLDSELCDFHKSILDESRAKDDAKCPILQYV